MRRRRAPGRDHGAEEIGSIRGQTSAFRSWLERAELYLRTIAALLLSAMAVAVGFEANRVATQQTRLAEATLGLQRATSPSAIRLAVAAPSSSGDVGDYQIEVWNDGGPCDGVFVREQVFVDVGPLVPVFYFDRLQYTFQSTGLLCRLTAWGPRSFTALAREFKDRTGGDMGFQGYIEVSHTDRLTQQSKTDCYRIAPPLVWRLVIGYLPEALTRVNETYYPQFSPTRQTWPPVIIDTSWPGGSASGEDFNPYKHNRTFDLLSVDELIKIARAHVAE